MIRTVLLFCGANVLQTCRRVPWEKSCIRSKYEGRKYTVGATDVADPKMLVLLFAVDMPHANAQKSHQVPLLCNIVPVLINPQDPWIPIG